MEITSSVDICRLCLAKENEFSEPLSNWVDNVLMLFEFEVFLDNELPQQICIDCRHTLMIATKLRSKAYETDELLKAYHRTDIKPNLTNKRLHFALQNAIDDLNETEDIIEKKLTVGNVCRLCLTESEEFSEPLINWANNVLLIFKLEVSPDDGLPQQFCLDCCHTLMTATKLRNTAYETDMLFKTYHDTDIKPNLENDEFLNFTLNNNTMDESNKTKDVVIGDIKNTKLLEQYQNRIDEPSDVQLKNPILNGLIKTEGVVIMNSSPIIKPKVKVMLKKLPNHVSSTSLIYCSVCLLAFIDRERFNIHLNLNIHKTDQCSFCCIKFVNEKQHWDHIIFLHINEILDSKNINNKHYNRQVIGEDAELLKLTVEKKPKCYTNKSERRLKKIVEYQPKWEAVNETNGAEWPKSYAYMNKNQQTKRAECRKYYDNMNKKQQTEVAECSKNYVINIKEEQTEEAECSNNNANLFEEQQTEIAECPKNYANIIKEEQMEEAECSKNYPNTIKEEQTEEVESSKNNDNMIEEQQIERAECSKKKSNMIEEEQTEKAERPKHHSNKIVKKKIVKVEYSKYYANVIEELNELADCPKNFTSMIKEMRNQGGEEPTTNKAREQLKKILIVYRKYCANMAQLIEDNLKRKREYARYYNNKVRASKLSQ